MNYIEENSFNLCYIYMFNILADSGYFPDKSIEMLDEEYRLDANYMIKEDQKKQFIKLMNSGRLSVMLDNEDYCPTDDQLLMSKKVKHTFLYLQ